MVGRRWQVLVFLVLMPVATVGLLRYTAARAARDVGAVGRLQPQVIKSSRHGISRPVNELAAAENLEGVLPERPATLMARDVVPEQAGEASSVVVIHNFEGLGNLDNVLPPGTNGDVGYDPATGRSYYMQWVNVSLAVWDVSDPAQVELVLGPAPGNSLWSGFKGVCGDENKGDAIVLFDQLAERWVAGQLAIPNYPQGPYYQCMAVSQTADPTGNWYKYEFEWPSGKRNDSPKLGVGAEAYYITANQFVEEAKQPSGAGVGAFNKGAMLQGLPATLVFFDLDQVDSRYRNILPADVDGAAPPVGTPGYFAAWDDSSWLGDAQDTLRLWELAVDFSQPQAATFGVNGRPNALVATANVDPDLCGGVRTCIPQPGGTPLDALSDRLMHRLAYRHLWERDVLLGNHTVDTGGDHAGIHWFELRGNDGSWQLAQEGVYAPDGAHRWLGSVAMDQAGNMALGYSVSSVTVYPSIRVAGRLATDTLGLLPRGETELVAGAGYQEHSAGLWGDYSMMAVDPRDDCTFWYTQEYYGTVGVAPWQTRIGSFQFENCERGAPGLLRGTISEQGGGPTVAGAQVTASASPTQTVATTSDARGVYTLTLAAGSYDVRVTASGFVPQTAQGVEVAAGGLTQQDFVLAPAGSYSVTGTVRDGQTGWPLYAAVSANGVTAWSDPVSGRFSMTLAGGWSYTLTATAWAAGYLTTAAVVENLLADTTVDLALQADGESCAAPGYVWGGESCVAEVGGLVVGHVYDGNSGAAIDGAQVANEAGYTALTAGTVDGAQAEGFYTLFAPAGSQLLTATVAGGGYGAESATVQVAANETVARDFSLAAGLLMVTPAEVESLLPPGGVSTATISLENSGGQAAGWEAALGPAVAWLRVAPITGTVAAGESEQLLVTFDAGAVAQPGVYQAALGLLNDTPYGTVTVPVTLTVQEAVYRVALGPAALSREGVAGETVTYTLSITNGSNVGASFILTAAGNDWPVELPFSTAALGAEESQQLLVQVAIPDGVAPGSEDVASITATLVDDPETAVAATLTTRALAADSRAVELVAAVSEGAGAAGEVVSYALWLTNKGSVVDSYLVSTSGNSWPATVVPVTVTVQAGAKVALLATVVVPDGAHAGELDNVTVAVRSLSDAAVGDQVMLWTRAVDRCWLPVVGRATG